MKMGTLNLGQFFFVPLCLVVTIGLAIEFLNSLSGPSCPVLP
jgi:hypothetical protein